MWKFFDDDVIIVTSSVHRTQPIYVLFSPPIIYHNVQMINNTEMRKMNKINNLMSPL